MLALQIVIDSYEQMVDHYDQNDLPASALFLKIPELKRHSSHLVLEE